MRIETSRYVPKERGSILAYFAIVVVVLTTLASVTRSKKGAEDQAAILLDASRRGRHRQRPAPAQLDGPQGRRRPDALRPERRIAPARPGRAPLRRRGTAPRCHPEQPAVRGAHVVADTVQAHAQIRTAARTTLAAPRLAD